jgi:predicted transcriptional regulator
MRPTAHPLNAILGSEIHVRILRALWTADAPVSTSEVARRTALCSDRVRRTLADLATSGVVELVGSSARRLARLRHDDPLTASMSHLFAAEAALPDDLPHDLRANSCIRLWVHIRW